MRGLPEISKLQPSFNALRRRSRGTRRIRSETMREQGNLLAGKCLCHLDDMLNDASLGERLARIFREEDTLAL
jgi:division protein CdvB (Snf7/Vps24/ESCRT-III family)